MGLRRLPSKVEILERAKEIAMQRQVIGMKEEPITPTERELKETGVYHEARLELMRSPTTGWESEQRRYIFGMAEENLRVTLMCAHIENYLKVN